MVKLPALKDFNLLRLSGVREIIIVEIMPEEARIIALERKEVFTKIKNGDVLKSLKILHRASCPLDDDFHKLKLELKDLIEKLSLKDPVVIAGISEFRHFIAAVPLDTEDIDLWFLENSGRFLPEGKPRDEFAYSYELLRKDDNSSHYNVAVVRCDCLRRLEAALNIKRARLFAIYPFLVSIHLNGFTQDSNILLLQISKTRLTYSTLNADRLYQYGELYNDFTHDGQLNLKALGSGLNDLKGILAQSLKYELTGADSVNKLHVLLDIDVSYFTHAEAAVKSVFRNAEVNENIKDPSLVVPFIGLNHVFNNSDSGLNLVKDGEMVRFALEKQLTMRAVLLSGMVVIILLVSLFLSETFLSSKIRELEESQADAVSKTGLAEQMQKENRHLKMNLGMIGSIKGSGAEYTTLLRDMTKVVTAKSSFTGIVFKTGEGAFVNCEVSGLAVSQEEVAKVVERMERLKNFQNVSLLFAGYKDRQGGFGNYNDEKNKMIHFNIAARYNAD